MYWFCYVSPDGKVVKENQEYPEAVAAACLGEFQGGEAYIFIVHSIVWVPFTLHAYEFPCEIREE